MIVYIGDGLSDLQPASKADIVFATGHLAELLKLKKIAWTSFDDFHDITKKLLSLELQ